MFITLTDTSGRSVLLRTDLIAKIEESSAVIKTEEVPLSKITFTDKNLPAEYVVETLNYIRKLLTQPY